MLSRRAFLSIATGTSIAIPLSGWITFRSNDTIGQAEDTWDDAAIQRAIDAAAENSNAEVHLPAGNYVIRQTIRITHPVRLIGAGVDTTTLDDQSGVHVFEVSDTSDVEISGLTIRGAHEISDTGSAVRARDVTNLTVRDCRFTDIAETGVRLQRVHGGWISGCEFNTIGMSGIRLEDPGEGANDDIRIQGNTFRNIVTSRSGGHSAIQAHHQLPPRAHHRGGERHRLAVRRRRPRRPRPQRRPQQPHPRQRRARRGHRLRRLDTTTSLATRSTAVTRPASWSGAWPTAATPTT